MTTVILLGHSGGLGAHHGDALSRNINDLDGLNVIHVAPPEGEAPLAARLCAAITRLAPAPPMVIVASGTLAGLLPSIALAQRAARRRVLAYVLVDPEYPEVSDGWPDARVHVLCSPGVSSRTAELRGWDNGSVTQLRDLLESLAHDSSGT